MLYNFLKRTWERIIFECWQKHKIAWDAAKWSKEDRADREKYQFLKKTDLPNIPDLCIETEYKEFL